MSDSVSTTTAPPKRKAGRPPLDSDPRSTRELHDAMREAARQIPRNDAWLQATLAQHRVSRVDLMPRKAMLKILAACDSLSFESLMPLVEWHTTLDACTLDELHNNIRLAASLLGDGWLQWILNLYDVHRITDLDHDFCVGILAERSARGALISVQIINADQARKAKTRTA